MKRVTLKYGSWGNITAQVDGVQVTNGVELNFGEVLLLVLLSQGVEVELLNHDDSLRKKYMPTAGDSK